MNQPKRILVVDIDPEILTKLEILFEDRGYDTTTAWGGQDALDYLQRQPFDLVLMSDYLPDIPSCQLCKAIPPGVSVALLQTAAPVKEVVEGYRRMGGRCFLNRTSPSNIVDSVHQCLISGERSPINAVSMPLSVKRRGESSEVRIG
jgi:CheY-like chemotaxis protein